MRDAIVNIKNLSYKYRDSATPVLKNIDLQIYPGETVILTGPSGCGKSTLSLCLTGFIPHAYQGDMEGTVTINNMDTRDFSPGNLAGVVGLVQQDPELQLCTLKVLDEVAFGPENLCLQTEVIKERVGWALKVVGARHLSNRNIHTLSGGEKQKVAIASVLAMKPSLLILDEPTANLDPSSTSEVLEVIDKLRDKENTAVLIIEHRLEKILPFSNRLIVMKDGIFTEEYNKVKKGKIELMHDKLSRPYKLDKVYCNFHNFPVTAPAGKNPEPVLKVRNIDAGYDGNSFLKNISFDARPGEIIGIMGDNGSGKTTLLHSLIGIAGINKGEVLLNNKKITNQKVTKRAASMGLSFQNPNHQIFENTVQKEAELPSVFLRNISWGKNPKAIDLLKDFDLINYKDGLPFALSLGEKKRLTLVSLLAYTPELLMLDEPLVGQDPLRLDTLYKALREHRKNGGVTLMICHEPEVAYSWCHHILFLKEGELIINNSTGEAFGEMADLGMREYLPPEKMFSAIKKIQERCSQNSCL